VRAAGNADAAPDGEDAARAILFYDGVCGLCGRLVRFLLKRDDAGRLRYSPLQSAFAADVLRGHGVESGALDTVYLLSEHGGPREILLSRSSAVLAALELLGAGWRRLARAVGAVPRPWRDAAYDGIARIRYRVFGRSDRCAVPSPDHRDRFIEAGGARR